ncbi:MAG: putative tellurium resistance membrane protein TerC [Cyclobacteriaceae bacterium]|jgi:predicted tellurium resistance membrane protein TerC
MSDKVKFAFKKANYMIMLAGVFVLIIGFAIMGADDETFGFGFFGITLGPIVVMLGFITEFVAIFYKTNKNDPETGHTE